MATKKLTPEQKEANKLKREQATKEQTNQVANEASETTNGDKGIEESQTEHVSADTERQQAPEGTEAPAGTGAVDPGLMLKATGAYTRLHGHMPDPSLTVEDLNQKNEQRRSAIDAYENSYGISPDIKLKTNQINDQVATRNDVIAAYERLFGTFPEKTISQEELEFTVGTRNQLKTDYENAFGSSPTFDMTNDQISEAVSAKLLEDKKEQSLGDLSADQKKRAEEEREAIDKQNAITKAQQEEAVKQRDLDTKALESKRLLAEQEAKAVEDLKQDEAKRIEAQRALNTGMTAQERKDTAEKEQELIDQQKAKQEEAAKQQEDLAIREHNLVTNQKRVDVKKALDLAKQSNKEALATLEAAQAANDKEAEKAAQAKYNESLYVTDLKEKELAALGEQTAAQAEEEKKTIELLELQKAQDEKDAQAAKDQEAALISKQKELNKLSTEEQAAIQKENEEKFFEEQRLLNDKAKAEAAERQRAEQEQILKIQEEQLEADLASGNYVLAEKVNANGEIEKKKFSKTTWQLLKDSRDGWKETVKTPKEVQKLKNK